MSRWFSLCSDHDSGLRICRECRRNPSRREHDKAKADKGQSWMLPNRDGNRCRDQMWVSQKEEDAA